MANEVKTGGKIVVKFVSRICTYIYKNVPNSFIKTSVRT